MIRVLSRCSLSTPCVYPFLSLSLVLFLDFPDSAYFAFSFTPVTLFFFFQRNYSPTDISIDVVVAVAIVFAVVIKSSLVVVAVLVCRFILP